MGIPSFTEHLWWLVLSSLKQKSENEKIYPHEYIHNGVFFSTVAELRANNFTKNGLLISKVLQNLIFTEDSWGTASDFQQHFGHRLLY